MSQTTVPYNHRAVEQKWRKVWEDKPINVNDGKKPKETIRLLPAPLLLPRQVLLLESLGLFQ